MSETTIRPRDWVNVRECGECVVCQVCERGDEGEVVFLDDRDRAINVVVVLRDGAWFRKFPPPDGGYADKYQRLSEFVQILRRGRTL